MSILSRFWRILGVLVFGMSVFMSMSISKAFGINGVMELEWIDEAKRSTVRFCFQNVDFAKFWKLISKIMISNPKPQPKSIFQILNPKSNLTIKFISLSAFQILSNYLQTTKFDLQTTHLAKFFYHILWVLGTSARTRRTSSRPSSPWPTRTTLSAWPSFV